ncbi:MAG: c-type cytochrome biogenesis protein CcsB [Desulfobacterales bacterium]|nr:MAG: c-type cytochrome biogenesis protein CcsB [Desulfobacterales bacterium]
MNELITLFYGLTLLVTALSCGLYLFCFWGQRENLRSCARNLLFASGLLQTVVILLRLFVAGHTPITSPFETVLFFAWSTTWAFLSFHWRFSVRNFGTVVSILILLLLAGSLGADRDVITLPPKLQSFWLPIHAGFSILSYGFFSLAFCGGAMYVVLERELKRKRLGFLFDRLPSLDALDQLNSHCVTIGFGLYTIGLLTGVLWTNQVYGAYWKGGAKEVWSLIIWLALLVQIHQRYSVGWRGRQAALMIVLTFVVILLTLLGITWSAGGVHGHAI